MPHLPSPRPVSATATLGASYSGQFGDGVEDHAIKLETWVNTVYGQLIW